MRSTRRSTAKQTATPPRKVKPKSQNIASSTLYSTFRIYDGRRPPTWHPVQKMRYVFFRMISGCTITDALTEIQWHPSEFWHLVDLKRNAPFRVEYARARMLQGRAFADAVVTVSEGRDRTTRQKMRAMRKILEKGMRRATKMKSPVAVKAILESMMARIDANEHGVIQRNKLQIDANKWMAKTMAPSEFGETSRVSLGSPPVGSDEPQNPIIIQFVGPDGKVVPI